MINWRSISLLWVETRQV